jgi:hypothetical protein
MEAFDRQIGAQQRRTFDFMLDALGLEHDREETHRATRLLRPGQPAHALLREHRRLRLRVAELDHEIDAVEAELDALDRAVDARIDARRERRPDEI